MVGHPTSLNMIFSSKGPSSWACPENVIHPIINTSQCTKECLYIPFIEQILEKSKNIDFLFLKSFAPQLFPYHKSLVVP